MRASTALKAVCPTPPDNVPQLAFPVAAHVTAAASVTSAGSASPTVTSSASDGPAFVTVTVYTAVPPGVYVALPSAFVTSRATVAARASLSDADVLAVDDASDAVTVLTSGSVVRPGSDATGTVSVRAFPAPAGTAALLTETVRCPAAPVRVPHVAPPDATHDAAALSRTAAGSASATFTASASDCPVLVSVMVYIARPPGV
jgi:hypothetical protein